MTSTTKTVIASTTAALAVATGIVVSNYDSKEDIDWNSVAPNICKYIPEFPEINLKSGATEVFASLENFNNLDMSLNNNIAGSEENINSNELSNYCINNNDISNYNTQSYGNYKSIKYVKSDYVVYNDQKELNEEIKIIENYNESTPESLLNCNKLTIAKISFNITNSNNISIILPMIDVDQGLIKAREVLSKAKLYFKDKRNLEYDKTIVSNEYMDKWFKIYENYKNKSFSIVPINNEFRMISEVKLPKNNNQLKILNKNLSYYKYRGYDSVLIVFDGSEEPEELLNLVKFIRYKGFRSYFAFGGDESLYISIFVNPDKLKKQLQSLAEYSEGFLIGWRRTSAHLVEQDIQYMNYMTDCVRGANKNCLIFGELYYGNTAKYHKENKWGFGYNLPNYASGVVVCNFGYDSVNVESVIKYIVPSKIGNNHNQIAVITGQRPYYLTVHKNNLTQKQNQKIKENLELRFKKAGCKGTITLHDDGRNGIGGYRINNNLSETIFTSLK